MVNQEFFVRSAAVRRNPTLAPKIVQRQPTPFIFSGVGVNASAVLISNSTTTQLPMSLDSVPTLAATVPCSDLGASSGTIYFLDPSAVNDRAFYHRTIQAAINHRSRIVPNRASCRLRL